jgi:hypothetical protein
MKTCQSSFAPASGFAVDAIVQRHLLFSCLPPRRNSFELLYEGTMRPQVCDHCGGRFGLVTHRWWNNKFCKRTCKEAHLRELAFGRDQIRRWYGFLFVDGFKTSLTR